MTTVEAKSAVEVEKVWRNATVLSMAGATAAEACALLPAHDVHVRAGRIVAVQPTLPASAYACDSEDVGGALLTPGLIDCHTHLVFGGNRAHEWAQRLNGVPYADIAAQGGGIASTVQATRNMDAEALFQAAMPRLQALMAEGVTTLEAKTGYGLSLAAERKQLQVLARLAATHAVELVPTLLSAHALPPEYAQRADDYIDLVCTEILPVLWQEGWFEAVDVFCEGVGFSLAQTERVFQAATRLGIPVKGHTEQLSHLGGSALVARYGGLSADHVEYLDEAGVAAMQANGTVAVLLPLAYYFLRETQKPPIDLLRRYGVPMAVSTDFNPGTAPMASLRLAMNMACVQFGLTPDEAWLGVTRHAAQALGRSASHGRIAPGYVADLLLWDAERPVEVIYELGRNPLRQRLFRGANRAVATGANT